MSDGERIRIGERVTMKQRGKRKTWVAEFWKDGEHRRKSLKTSNKRIAEERARKIEVELADGTFRQAPPAVAVSDSVNQYITYLETEGRARKTIVKYRGILTTFAEFLATSGATRLNQIATSHLDKFRESRRLTHALKSMYSEGVIIKQWVKWAKSRRLTLENPFDAIRLSKPKTEPKARPNSEEVARIIAAAKGPLKLHLAMLAYTGIRSGELQRIRLEDLDVAGGWLHVVSRVGHETKTRSSRKIPMHPLLREILQETPRGKGPWLFTAEPSRKFPEGGHWINPKKLNERFLRLVEKLSLPSGRVDGYTIHSLRRAFEDVTVNNGIPQRVVDAWMGHNNDRSMAAIYYRLADEESQKFMRKVPFGNGVPAADAGEMEVSQ